MYSSRVVAEREGHPPQASVSAKGVGVTGRLGRVTWASGASRSRGSDRPTRPSLSTFREAFSVPLEGTGSRRLRGVAEELSDPRTKRDSLVPKTGDNPTGLGCVTFPSWKPSPQPRRWEALTSHAVSVTCHFTLRKRYQARQTPALKYVHRFFDRLSSETWRLIHVPLNARQT